MLVLHDPDTLLHRTIELLGAKLIPAIESPERITAILEALEPSLSSQPSSSSEHEVSIIGSTSTPSDNATTPPSSSASASASSFNFSAILAATHDAGYLTHLAHAHGDWLAASLLTDEESVLPECFPFPSTAVPGADPPPPSDIYARAGYYAFDMSSGIAAHTWRAAHASARLAFEGVRLLLGRDEEGASCAGARSGTGAAAGGKEPPPPRAVLALCRPPGHHCDSRRAGGYCYLNNAVVAVRAWQVGVAATVNDDAAAVSAPISPLQPSPSSSSDSPTLTTTTSSSTAPPPPLTHAEASRSRVAILDIDYHHGNGTQHVFYADASVFYASIHGAGEFPYYTGFAHESGAVGTAAAGTTLNLPLPPRSSAAVYLAALDTAVRAIRDFRPAMLVVSLGFDTDRLDPLGGFELEGEDYHEIGRRVGGLVSRDGRAAGETAGEGAGVVPALILLEGGYVLERLGSNLKAFLKGWEDVVRGT